MASSRSSWLLPSARGEFLSAARSSGERLRVRGGGTLLRPTPAPAPGLQPDPRGEPLGVRGEVIPITWKTAMDGGSLQIRLYPPA